MTSSKRTARGGHISSGVNLSRIQFSVLDGERVQGAARTHFKVLAEIGVTTAELDRQRQILTEVKALISRRGTAQTEEVAELELRDGALQELIDAIAHVRRMADLEFRDSRPNAEQDLAALRAFGVGTHVPVNVPGAERAVDTILAALSNPKNDWKKAIARRGVDSQSVKALQQQLDLAKRASDGRTSAKRGHRQATSALETAAADLRRLTSYLRKAGNDRFAGKPERKDFDPPPRVRTKRRPKKVAQPPAAAAAAGGE